MDNPSVFQTDDPGSIPGTGSAGCVGKVSRWPHKPCIRVRVPYPLFRATLCRGIQAGKVCQINGVVAQMEEHLPCKQKAAGSKPVGSISLKKLIGKLRKGERKNDVRSGLQTVQTGRRAVLVLPGTLPCNACVSKADHTRNRWKPFK